MINRNENYFLMYIFAWFYYQYLDGQPQCEITAEKKASSMNV